MSTRDPRVDAYIAKAAPFAQPILSELRRMIHTACPPVVETIKWGMPFFEHQGLLCHFAAFKAHCAFGVWRGRNVVPEASDEAMGQLGRVTSLADLPSQKTLAGWLQQAMQRNAEGIKTPRAPAKPVEVPAALAAALKKNQKARAGFEAFTPGKQREYCEWISEAKAEATRERRLAQAMDLLADGKPRHWKYEGS